MQREVEAVISLRIPWDCRHFWAISASEAGTDLENLKQADGWASLEMPSRYIQRHHIANERVKLGGKKESVLFTRIV